MIVVKRPVSDITYYIWN